MLVDEINALENELEALSEDALRGKTEEFRRRLAHGERLEKILPEAFGIVREASKRTIGLRHYDVQLIGGAVLHEGKIAEMRTGEGKTLVATLPLYLNALTGKGVHVITVNDYLARRDSQWMGRIFRMLGLQRLADLRRRGDREEVQVQQFHTHRRQQLLLLHPRQHSACHRL